MNSSSKPGPDDDPAQTTATASKPRDAKKRRRSRRHGSPRYEPHPRQNCANYTWWFSPVYSSLSFSRWISNFYHLSHRIPWSQESRSNSVNCKRRTDLPIRKIWPAMFRSISLSIREPCHVDKYWEKPVRSTFQGFLSCVHLKVVFVTPSFDLVWLGKPTTSNKQLDDLEIYTKGEYVRRLRCNPKFQVSTGVSHLWQRMASHEARSEAGWIISWKWQARMTNIWYLTFNKSFIPDTRIKVKNIKRDERRAFCRES